MIWMKAEAVPFRIARPALAELLLPQALAYIVRSSMSTVRDAPTLLTCSTGEEPSHERGCASSLLLCVRTAWQHNGVPARQARARRLGRSSEGCRPYASGLDRSAGPGGNALGAAP